MLPGVSHLDVQYLKHASGRLASKHVNVAIFAYYRRSEALIVVQLALDSQPLIANHVVPLDCPIWDCDLAFCLQATEAVDEPLPVALAVFSLLTIANPDEFLDDLEYHVLAKVQERLSS